MVVISNEEVLVDGLNGELVGREGEVWAKAVYYKHPLIKNKIPSNPISLSRPQIYHHHPLYSIPPPYLPYGQTNVRIHVPPSPLSQTRMVEPASQVDRPSRLHGHFGSHDGSFELA